jgi:hypothetical protein
VSCVSDATICAAAKSISNSDNEDAKLLIAQRRDVDLGQFERGRGRLAAAREQSLMRPTARLWRKMARQPSDYDPAYRLRIGGAPVWQGIYNAVSCDQR